MRRIWLVPLVVLALMLVLATVVQAVTSYSYSCLITVNNTSANTYSNVAALAPLNGSSLISNLFARPDLLDVTLETQTGSAVPYDAYTDASDWHFFLSSLPAHSIVQYMAYLRTPVVSQFSFMGTATATSSATLNPGTDDFTLEATGLFTSAAGQELLYKPGAYTIETVAGTPLNLLRATVYAGDVTKTATSNSHVLTYSEVPPYSGAHNHTTGSQTDGPVGQIYTSSPALFSIYRSFLYFDTSICPTPITSATLHFYVGEDYTGGGDFNITIQNGQPNHPEDILAVGDYLYSYYSGDGGHLSTSGMSLGWNEIALTDTSWINAGGMTKLALRSSNDINSSGPTGEEYVMLNYSDHKPYLVIAAAPSLTTAIPTSEAMVKVEWNPPDFKLYVDGDVKGSTTVNEATVTSNSALTITENMSYVKSAKFTKGSTLTGHWFGSIAGTTSQDLSDSNNDATVTPAYVANQSGVTVTLGPLTPHQAASASWSPSQGPPNYVQSTPEQPSGMYTDNPGTNIPGGAMLNAAASAANTPVIFFWLILACGLSAVGAIVFYKVTQSFIVAMIVSVAVLSYFGFAGVIPWWMVLVYILFGVASVVVVKQPFW